MNAEIIGMGAARDRAVLARAADFLSRELYALGVDLAASVPAGPDKLGAERALARALDRSDVVILCGGLGPDGVTRQAVSEALDLPLCLDEDLLQRIRLRYQRAGREMPEAARSMALVLEGASLFPNRRGVAPGLALSAGSQCVLLLPEEPRELQPMFLRHGFPYLAEFAADTTESRTLRIFGLGARAVAEKLGALLDQDNPIVAVYPNDGEVMVRITGRAADRPHAHALCPPTLKTVVNRLGRYLYGTDDDTMQDVVTRSLREAGLTLAVGDYGGNGVLGDLLWNTEHGPELILESELARAPRDLTDLLDVPPELLRQEGPVSARAAAAMAAGGRSWSDSSLGVAVTLMAESGGDQPYGLAYVAVCDRKNLWVKELELAPTGRETPARMARMAALYAMDLLRLYLDYYPDLMPGGVILAEALQGRNLRAQQPDRTGPAPPRKPRRWYQRVLPWKGDRKGELVRKSVFLAAVAVLLASLAYIAGVELASRANLRLVSGMESAYLDAQSAGSRPEGYPQRYQAKFASWWEENPEVAGRIEIEGTDLKYAVVQGGDNEYYLRRNFRKESSKHGVPFVDAAVDLKAESDNTIIYGHNMSDGQIFTPLLEYKQLDYYQEHPVVTFDSVYRDGQYKIFSIFITNAQPTGGPVWQYHKFIDGTDAQFQDYVNQALARSLIRTTVDVKPGDKLLTLSTCTYEFQDARFVIMARKVRPGESAEVDVAGARKNSGALMPDGFYDALSQAEAASQSDTASQPEAASQSEAASQTEAATQSEAASRSEMENGSSAAPPSSSGSSGSSSAPESSPGSSSVSSSSSSSQPSSDSPADEIVASEVEPSESGRPSSEDEVIASEEDPPSREEEEEPSSGGVIAMDDTVEINGEDMEAYDAICQIVMNETGGTFRTEALKAQAVALYSRMVARNGALSGNLRAPNSAVKNAVKAVWGETLEMGGKVVDAYFYSTSAGMTNTSKEVWGGVLPGHMENVDSHWDEDSPYYGMRARMSREDVVDRVYRRLGVDLDLVDDDQWFEVLSTTGGGYVDKIRVGGEKTTTGRYLRETVLNLRSAAFEWEFDGDYVVFTTYGYGHGCGMSQNGANSMAGEGYDYQEILEHYYPGCTVR